MHIRLFVGCALLASCAGSHPPPETAAQACLRMDERAGVAPSLRRACWDRVAATDGPLRPHAAARALALSGTRAEATVADDPARLRLTPVAPGALPAPASAPAPPRSADCVTRARTCDEGCTGSAAWATCLARCDTELTRCLLP